MGVRPGAVPDQGERQLGDPGRRHRRRLDPDRAGVHERRVFLAAAVGGRVQRGRHPEVLGDKPDAKPEEILVAFFESHAKAHPGTFPVQDADKKVAPARAGTVIQALFFDMWLQDPANKAKVADIEPVPADFVTASGAGMDPHITLRNARWQLPRVAAARAGSVAAAAARQRIEAILNANVSSPLGGLAGEPLVNVLAVNLRLDAEFANK